MDDMNSTTDMSQDRGADFDRFSKPFYQALSSVGYQQLTGIECSVVDDIIVLTGKLDSFYLKQVAQSVAIKIPGVRSVKNEIEVD